FMADIASTYQQGIKILQFEENREKGVLFHLALMRGRNPLCAQDFPQAVGGSEFNHFSHNNYCRSAKVQSCHIRGNGRHRADRTFLVRKGTVLKDRKSVV